MKTSSFNELRARAQEYLKQSLKKTPTKEGDVTTLIEELTLYQVELEIQNEDLLLTQADLVKSKNKYVDLYELAPLAYFAISKDAVIQEVNQAGCALLDLSKSALINRCFSRYIQTSYQSVFSQYKQQAFKELIFQSFELKLLKWNKPSFYASIDCKVVNNDAENDSPLLLMFITDITAKKNAQIALHKDRIKMAAIDRLRSLYEFIYAISEDQNHSITIMNNYISGCIRRLESGNFKHDELMDVLKKISSEVEALTEVIRLRKINIAKSVFRFEIADINNIINQLIMLIEHEMDKYPVMIQFEKSALSLVKVDIFHMQQAILNITRNCIEAMRDAQIEEPKILIEAVQKDNYTVEITIIDNGPGFVNENIKKIFNPHFSTKPYGIGLGLSVSKAIIEKHGGNLFATSNPGGGACIGFTLPCMSVGYK